MVNRLAFRELISKKNLILILSFSLIMFESMTSLTFLDARSAVSASESAVSLHYADYLFFLAGYLLYAVLGRQLSAESKKNIFIAFSLLFLLTIILSQSDTVSGAFFITSFLATFFLGFLGSILCSVMAVNLKGSLCTGGIVALAQSLAILLQYAAMQTNLVYPFLIASGILSLCIAVHLHRQQLISFDLSAAEGTKEKENSDLRTEVITAAVVLICLEFISGFNDGFYVRLFSAGQIDLYGSMRLILIPGFLLAGWLADFNNRKYFAISVICVYMISVFAPILLEEQRYQYLNLGLMYMYLSFLVIYFNVTFFDIAANSSNPEFYAPLGRIIDIIASILFSLIAVSVNTYLVLAIHLVLLIIAWSIQIWKAQRTDHRKETVNDSQSIDDFIQLYGLTERESEIARQVLLKGESIKQLSQELFISERVLYRHLSHIYEKTGTDSRMSLLIKYRAYLSGHQN